jgi:hypothetical protein
MLPLLQGLCFINSSAQQAPSFLANATFSEVMFSVFHIPVAPDFHFCYVFSFLGGFLLESPNFCAIALDFVPSTLIGCLIV